LIGCGSGAEAVGGRIGAAVSTTTGPDTTDVVGAELDVVEGGADVDTSADGSDIPAPPSESLPHAVTTSAAASVATSTLRRGSAPPLGPGPERRVRVSNAISVIALVSPIRPPDLFSHS